jgi:hypothetical protein
MFGGEKELVLMGCTDASFQTDMNDSKSQFSFVFCLNGGAVSSRYYSKFDNES